MSTLVTVNVGGSIVIIRCDGIDQDPILPGNVRLAYTYELLTQDAEGRPWDTDVWSVPKSQVISYARGKPYEEPAPEPTPEPEPVPELDPEQKARAARRRAELREADRMMLEMARERLDAREASTAETDPTASTPPTEQAPAPRKPARAKRPARGRKKPA